jgi:anti-anti-sigma factor
MSDGKRFDVREERRGDALVLRGVGRLDSNTSDEFHALVAERLRSGVSRLVIDLTGVDYVSSAGLRVLLLAAKSLEESGGRLALAGLNPSVKQVFALSGLLKIFTVEADAESALARVAG